MSSTFHMIDVGSKPVTHRRAVACGQIQLSERVRVAIREKTVPKGDVLMLAEVAGIGAAKRTAEILPLCHPLTLDSVQVNCEVDDEQNRVVVTCEVAAQGRTGVEMEALSGVSAALLCVYDLTKGLDKGAIISEIKLLQKEGGKSGRWLHPDSAHPSDTKPEDLVGLRCGVVTVSDRVAHGELVDESGRLLAEYLRNHGGELVIERVVPDEVQQIRLLVEEAAMKSKLDLLLLTGGTGLGPRDVSPEALQPLWTKTLPGFGERFRSHGLCSTPRAWLSRAEAGLVGVTLVALLPGSPGAVRDGLTVLGQMIPHMIRMIRGGKH